MKAETHPPEEPTSSAIGLIVSFWDWIASGLVVGVIVLIMTVIVNSCVKRRDRRQLTARTSRNEYTQWKGRYVSGELTGVVPTEEDLATYLRWFAMRHEDNENVLLLSNRGEVTAANVRVTSEHWPTGKFKRRRRIRPGKSIRLKMREVPDRFAHGVHLDVHWDDKNKLGWHVRIFVPLAEELPKPVVRPSDPDDGVEDAAGALTDRSASPDGDAQSSVEMSKRPPLAEAGPSIVSAPAKPSVDSDDSRDHVSHAGPPRKLGGPLLPSRNIADRTIPNRTPGLPANFTFVKRNDGTLGLRNQGPGDASRVYLQPHDDTYAVLDGGFWDSIPAGQVAPVALVNGERIGLFKVRFELTWDDGYALERCRELNVPGIGD